MGKYIFSRIIIIVLDSVGMGALPDAYRFGDEDSNTLLHIAEAVGGLSLPNLERLGLGNIILVPGIKKVLVPLACFGKMQEKSAGKDTTSGHWELMGIILDTPFPVYPNGFPPDIIEPLEKAIGRKIIGNKPASGTEIIKELGEEHLISGAPIVYTSADSVFQIAAHQEVIPLEELYKICEIAFSLLSPKRKVARVIARPFMGSPGNFRRTEFRRDYSIPPPSSTVLDRIVKAGLEVIGIGKIEDIFAGRGLTKSIHTNSNQDGVNKIFKILGEKFIGVAFVNLVDFDMLYGHRNNPIGYAQALKEFDDALYLIIEKINEDDLLIITADHGCDPTTKSTDHSREYVPLLVYSKKAKSGVDLGIRETFADVGASVATNFLVESPAGKEFISEIR